MWAIVWCLGILCRLVASQLPLAASDDFMPTLCESVRCGHYTGVIENEFGDVVHRSLVGSDRHQRAYFMGSPGSQLLLYRQEKDDTLALVAATQPAVSSDQLSMLQQCLVPGNYTWQTFSQSGNTDVYNVWLALDPNGYGPCLDESDPGPLEEPTEVSENPDVASQQLKFTDDSVKPFDSTAQPLDQVPFDSTAQPLDQMLFDSPAQPLDQVPFDSTAQPLDQVPFDSTAQPLDQVPFDSTVQSLDQILFDSPAQPLDQVPFDSTAQPLDQVPFDSTVQSLDQVLFDSPAQPLDQVPLDISPPIAASNSASPQLERTEQIVVDYPNYVDEGNMAYPAAQALGSNDKTISIGFVMTSPQNKEVEAPYMENSDLGMTHDNVEEEKGMVGDPVTQNFDWIVPDNQVGQPLEVDARPVPTMPLEWPAHTEKVFEDDTQQPFDGTDDVLVGSEDWYEDATETPQTEMGAFEFSNNGVAVKYNVWASTQSLNLFSPSLEQLQEPLTTATTKPLEKTLSEPTTASSNINTAQSSAPADTADSLPREQQAPMMATSTTEQHLTTAVIVTGSLCLLLLILLLVVACVWAAKKRHQKTKYVFNSALELPKSVNQRKRHSKATSENRTAFNIEKTSAWYASPVLKRNNQKDQTNISCQLDIDLECGDNDVTAPVSYRVTIPARSHGDSSPPAYPLSPVSDDMSVPLPAAGSVSVSENGMTRASRKNAIDDDSVWHNVDLASQGKK